MTRLTRRRILTLGATLSTGVLAGCFGSDDSTDDEQAEELLSENTETIVSTGEGIKGRVRSVRHNPDEGVARVAGEINVPREAEYRVRLGVVDSSGVVLAEAINEVLLYRTGTNLEETELQVANCEACYSGLLEVQLTEAEKEVIQQKQERQREREQEQERQENESADDNQTTQTES